MLSFYSLVYLFIILENLGYLTSSPPASSALRLSCTLQQIASWSCHLIQFCQIPPLMFPRVNSRVKNWLVFFAKGSFECQVSLCIACLQLFLSIVFACDELVCCSLRGTFVYMFKTISSFLRTVSCSHLLLRYSWLYLLCSRFSWLYLIFSRWTVM